MKLPRRKFFHLAVGVRAASFVTDCAGASLSDAAHQVHYSISPGGSYDAIGRPWANRMKAFLGTVVVENPGRCLLHAWCGDGRTSPARRSHAPAWPGPVSLGCTRSWPIAGHMTQ
jgi:hypothetical protein